MVIDALLDVGVNLNQTALVVDVVAPPHAPAGPELVAPCKLAPVTEHVTVEVRDVAVLQLAWAIKFWENVIKEIKKIIKILTKRMDFINQFWLRTRIIGQRSY